MTISNLVVAKIHLHLIGIILKDNSKFCLSRNSIASHRNFSKTFPNCVLAEIQLPLIEIITRQFQIVS